jgi:hypothetical protein
MTINKLELRLETNYTAGFILCAGFEVNAVMAVQIYISSGPLAVCVKLDFLA